MNMLTYQLFFHLNRYTEIGKKLKFFV